MITSKQKCDVCAKSYQISIVIIQINDSLRKHSCQYVPSECNQKIYIEIASIGLILLFQDSFLIR